MKADVIYKTLRVITKQNINFLTLKKELDKGGSKLSDDLKQLVKIYSDAYDILNNRNLSPDSLSEVANILNVKVSNNKKDIFVFSVLIEKVNVETIPSIMSCISRLSRGYPEFSFFIGAYYIDKTHDIDIKLSLDYSENVKTMHSVELMSYIKCIIKDK